MEYISQASFILLIASIEGFINLLYQLYLKDSIRDDKELVKRISLERLILKIKMFPVHCEGFISIRKLVLKVIKCIISMMEHVTRRKLKAVLHDYYIGYVIRNGKVTFVQHKLDW
ncbi:MAG: hypothetical protein WA941_06085 [Nitrososphaeraceae archaeon]